MKIQLSDEIAKESTLRRSSTLSWLMKCLILAPVIAMNMFMVTIVSIAGLVTSIPSALVASYHQLRAGDLSGVSLLNIVVTILMPTIAILNALWYFAGIWLAILGDWRMVVYGTAVAFFAGFFISWLLWPSMLLAPIVMAVEKTRNNICKFVVAFLSLGYTSIIAALWISKQFDLVLHHTHPAGLIPACIWSFGVATLPWSALVSDKLDNEYEILMLLGIQVSSIVLMIGFGVFHFSFWTALGTAGSILMVGALIQTSLALLQQH